MNRILLKRGFTLRHMLHETSRSFDFAKGFNSDDETCCMKERRGGGGGGIL